MVCSEIIQSTCSEFTCLNHPLNGQVTYSSTEEDTAVYSCNDGYRLSDPMPQLCHDGTWSGSSPTCDSKF